MLGFAKKILGSSNDRKVKAFQAQAQKINALEARFEAFSDDELRMMTQTFRDRIEAGESLDKLQNEAFAVAREASSAFWVSVSTTCSWRRHDPARRRHRRNADRRRQDPGRRGPCLS